MDGKMIKTKDFKGEISILHFWFIKCKPCIEEIPDWNRLQKQYSHKGINFIAFSRDSMVELKEFLMKKPFNFTLIPESESIIKSEFTILWGYPMTIVTDKDNKVIKAFGKLTEEDMQEISYILSFNDRVK
ncbi:MAG: TlpA family protein disulfide reductase [Saprospiraceae bacterium]|nr:TlpA family protein disulfide reductase [Saprospiraceae bacterium]